MSWEQQLQVPPEEVIANSLLSTDTSFGYFHGSTELSG
jgi:hypothetical protein